MICLLAAALRLELSDLHQARRIIRHFALALAFLASRPSYLNPLSIYAPALRPFRRLGRPSRLADDEGN